ncbi:MAG: putative molybdenum carrier protein [Desulfobacterales bacterium]|nr:putative molybdenum carrier protein [Desulfobacterales bacterium]
MIKKIISGGKSGVEIAALDAAIRLEIPHEGWCYRNRKTDTGVLPSHYNVKEIENPSYFERLEKNIIDSDGTVVLTYGQMPVGSKAVRNLADGHNKPLLNVNLGTHSLDDTVSLIREWMAKHEIETIFFTGSKTGRGGGSKIYDKVIQVIEGICGVKRERFFGFQEETDDTIS